jgi:diamine N-acetyltransferase
MTEPIPLIIRQAKLEEAEALTVLAARTFYDAFAATNTPENMQAYMSAAFTIEQLTTELRDPQSTFLLAELDGRLVGYAKLVRGAVPLCVPAERAIELSRLYVDQYVLGAGIGPALLQACFEVARREAYPAMFLGVWEHNPRAQAFYRKWGFERVGKHTFQMGDDPQTDWWMCRAL